MLLLKEGGILTLKQVFFCFEWKTHTEGGGDFWQHWRRLLQEWKFFFSRKLATKKTKLATPTALLASPVEKVPFFWDQLLHGIILANYTTSSELTPSASLPLALIGLLRSVRRPLCLGCILNFQEISIFSLRFLPLSSASAAPDGIFELRAFSVSNGRICLREFSTSHCENSPHVHRRLLAAEKSVIQVGGVERGRTFVACLKKYCCNLRGNTFDQITGRGLNRRNMV